MAHTISINVSEHDENDSGILAANVTIASGMNLSEEFATTAAQYALSTELGCDLETVEQLNVEASFENGRDFQWLISFASDSFAGYDEDGNAVYYDEDGNPTTDAGE